MFELAVPPALLDEVTERVLQRLQQQQPSTRWLSGAQQAAQYLDWPVARIYRRLHDLPHYREGARLMFRADELDAYIETGYEGPPRQAKPGAKSATRAHHAAPTPFHPIGRPHE